MLDRVLMLLASNSVLSCSGECGDVEGSGFKRLYGLAPVSKYFVTNEDGVSFCPLVSLIQDKVFLDSWSKLKNAIREGGIPFNRFHGTHAFEYPGLDARFNKLFNRGMYNHTTIVMKNILVSYEGFTHLQRLVDVGGGLGVTLNLITSKYPYIKGVNFDLPHVLEHAPPYPVTPPSITCKKEAPQNDGDTGMVSAAGTPMLKSVRILMQGERQSFGKAKMTIPGIEGSSSIYRRS
ncbi:hypothetical protein TIFTF001_037932 [Ficus carica]|uniref:O-methyltransferase C-terminal domain-containing protein n=1 Tax=Ficus carica TaxID=3494 RepID=A0AA88E7X3_FICCA|nr:hypothetical protein TIFTF001_037919 [Ficus carica]GMN68871.1 hypothetical protein TIFTF001_037922 [Ficus carica]GMN68878.1 hypothetical protein TIFTF001_037929 [Ficus carica]GMN68881.1 hypothetical protein TIFTF001_037932 [Ficus carica]